LNKFLPALVFGFLIFLVLIFFAIQTYKKQIRKKSVEVNEAFWAGQAEQLPWFKKWNKVLEWNEPFAKWFCDGQINASYACLDTHLKDATSKDKAALFWEDEEGNTRNFSYKELYEDVNKFASVLKNLGVKKGDNVVLYMPMIPEAVMAMLATARLGATHAVVFSAFSSQALKERIDDLDAKFVITADFGIRRGKKIPLKKIVDEAVEKNSPIQKVLVIKRFDQNLQMKKGRDFIYNDLIKQAESFVEPVPVESNHPLFVLHTSGTTGKPKGIMHATGGYLTYVKSSFKSTFDPSEDSIFWCTADIGWITGHSYVVYAPLLCGTTIFIYEGSPDFPDLGRWWQLIEKYKITMFYTAPTAIRMFIKGGDQWPAKYDLSSLKILGTVGEPINPDVWHWYDEKIGGKRCPIIDTWWQTETGGFMVAPEIGIKNVALKPGSATFPLPEIYADVVDENGNPVPAGTKGYLVIKKPWPGMMMGIYNDPEKVKKTYWSKFSGMYFPGDYAIKDKDGYFWMLGRADEVIKMAAHRIGTTELENAVVSVNAIAESAAVGVQDFVKGEVIVIFAIPKKDVKPDENLKKDVINAVRKQVGTFATPQDVFWVDALPKTRSGKIMRRLLKAVAEGKGIGDASTLEDETSIEKIREMYEKIKSSVKQTGQ
jgi:acetyl-CoA synthetase